MTANVIQLTHQRIKERYQPIINITNQHQISYQLENDTNKLIINLTDGSLLIIKPFNGRFYLDMTPPVHFSSSIDLILIQQAAQTVQQLNQGMTTNG